MGPVEDAVAKIARGEKEVDITGMRIGAVGAKALAVAIRKSASLQVVGLSNNHIRDEGATALAVVIEKSPSFLKILLATNLITNVGATALGRVWRPPL